MDPLGGRPKGLSGGVNRTEAGQSGVGQRGEDLGQTGPLGIVISPWPSVPTVFHTKPTLPAMNTHSRRNKTTGSGRPFRRGRKLEYWLGGRSLLDDRADWHNQAERLVALPDEKLAKFDIATLSLFCARGLPGAEGTDFKACRETLGTWASCVRVETERWWHTFVRRPEDYHHSPGQYRMMMLVTVLQQDLGVSYNIPFTAGDYDGRDSRNLQLHGLLSRHGGTCVTMPILYLAIGRRLGYPLYLVRAWGHLFARWEELGGERFNVECTSRGFASYSDDYYRTWPQAVTEEQVRKAGLFRNLGAREELAELFTARGHCLFDNLRFSEARESYDVAF